MADEPRWPTQQVVFGGGVIVLSLVAMGEVVLLPPGKLYERLLVIAVIVGILAARINSIRVCAALVAFASFEFICYLGTAGSWRIGRRCGYGVVDSAQPSPLLRDAPDRGWRRPSVHSQPGAVPRRTTEPSR